MAKERYVLERQIGTGGMGDVWLAKDSLLHRPVAVKFLQSTDDPRYKDLFLSEARTLASLQHPNITFIYDAVFDEAESRFYIMMEYVEGKPLSEIIEERDDPLPLEAVMKIASGVLQALSYAHQKGFVHRDIKPENIIIQGDNVKLTDFGLAALVSLLNQQTSGYIAGTPPYMSPEQIAGENIDGRSDLYALGVTLFEMLTGGRRPFENDTPHLLLTAHIEDEPPSVRQFEATVPLQLERIINRLLAKYPEARYESAREVLDIFSALQARQKFSQRYLQLLEPGAKPMVGREQELKQLASIWQELQSSQKSRLVIISGEPGVGRSRLITEFLGKHAVDQGIPALVGRCDELGAPYTPYAEILATIFEKGLVKPATIESQIQYLTDQLPNLAPLLNIDNPDTDARKSRTVSGGLWQTLTSRVPGSHASDPVQAQQQFFTSVLSILSYFGTSALYLNDAHFLDDASVSLTRFLVRQTKAPVLILAEVIQNGNDQSSAWFNAFSDEEKVTISLEPLSPDETRRYLQNLLEGSISDAVVRIIEKRSRGVPLQIDEITRHLTDMGDFYRSESGEWEYLPPSATGDLSQSLLSYTLTSAFTRQLDKLSPESKPLLAIAALIEPIPEFNVEMWLTVLETDAQREAARQVLDEAEQRRIVREIDAGRFAFRPPDIAAALVMLLTPARRRTMHRKIADTLQAQEGNPTLIGHHYEQAGLPTQAARYLETAGEQAVAANAIAQAIDCYKRAVGLVDSITGYEVLADLYRQQGAWIESKVAYEKAIELAKQGDDVEQQARLLNGMAFTLWLSDKYREAAQHSSAVLKLNGVSTLERATAESHLGMISWLLGRLKEAEVWCKKAVAKLQDTGEEAKLAEAYNRLGLVYFARGHFTEAADVTRRSLNLRRELGHTWGEAYCRVGLGQIEADQGNFNEAHSHFEAARNLFEEIQSNDGLMVVNTEAGRARLLQRSFTEAITLLKKALNLALEIDKRSAYGLGDIYLLIAQASLQLGDTERAKNAIQDGLKLVEPAGNQKYVATGKALLAQLYAAQEEPRLAEEMFKEAISLFEQVDHPAGLLRTQLRYARFLTQVGKNELAARLEQETRARAESISLYI